MFTLSDEQARISERILCDLETDLVNERAAAHFVLGGPGTGKTVILLWLMRALSVVSSDTRETWDLRLRATEPVIDLLERSSGWDLSGVADAHTSPIAVGDALFVDDPPTTAYLERALAAAHEASRPLVAAVDLFQLDHGGAAGTLATLVRTHAVQLHRVTECYRQRGNVGAAAAEVMDLSDEGSHAATDQYVRGLLSEIRYVTPGGTVRSYSPATLDDWRATVELLAGQRTRMWSFWPSVLVVVDEQTVLPAEWTARLVERVGEDNVRVVGLSDVGDIRGLEFQHALIVLSRGTRSLVQAGVASSAAANNAVRLLRIPYSRPRDSVTTFVR